MRNSFIASLLVHAAVLTIALTQWRSGSPRPAAQVPFQATLASPLDQPLPSEPDPVLADRIEAVSAPIEFKQASPVEFESAAPLDAPLSEAPRMVPRVSLNRPLIAVERAPPIVQVAASVAHPPHPLGCPPPRYPAVARRLGQQGVVKLRLVIDSTGAVTGAVLEKSSGFPILDRAALRAARGWRFRPAERDGCRVDGELVQPVEFRLR